MNTNFLKEWAIKLNVEANILAQNFDDALKEMENFFPDQSEETIFEKAKMKLKADYKRKFLTSAVPFIGMVIGATNISDNMEKTRNKQFEIYLKAKDESEKQGDKTILDKVFTNKIVKINEETKEIEPLWPKYKTDGTLSKVYGKPIPPTEETQSKMVFGVAVKGDSEIVQAFKLTLKGQSCNADLKLGKVTSFKAIDKSEKTDTMFTLETNRTDFISCKHEKIDSGLQRVGITGIIKTFFKDCITNWTDIKRWVKEKNDNPLNKPIPKKFTGFNSMMVIPAMCIYQNFTPDSNGRIKIILSDTNADDLDDTNVLCLLDKSLDKTIDFSIDSKVMVIGKPWLPTPKDDKPSNFIFLTSAIFAFPDWKIPRVQNVKPITPENLSSKAEIIKPVETEKPVETKQEEF